ncbi:MAG: hypothetical protein AB7F40_10425 [Victivallaceae bacterium]
MLKLTASYSKKVPADSEYSSQSYHCCVEIEIAEGLNQDQLDARIRDTFALVRDSVEAELHGVPAVSTPATYRKPQRNGQPELPASPKQIKFLLDLARNCGVTPEQLKARFGVAALENLTKTQCSRTIDEFNGKAVA